MLTYNEILKDFMDRRGLTAKEVAEKTGVTRPTVENYAKKTRKEIPIGFFSRMVEHFGFDLIEAVQMAGDTPEQKYLPEMSNSVAVERLAESIDRLVEAIIKTSERKAEA